MSGATARTRRHKGLILITAVCLWATNRVPGNSFTSSDQKRPHALVVEGRPNSRHHISTSFSQSASDERNNQLLFFSPMGGPNPLCTGPGSRNLRSHPVALVPFLFQWCRFSDFIAANLKTFPMHHASSCFYCLSGCCPELHGRSSSQQQPAAGAPHENDPQTVISH